MKLLNERWQVRDVAARWRQQYPKGFASDEQEEIFQKLDALFKETATSADVAAIIGNSSWVKPEECNECGEVSYMVVEVGEEPDYESRTAILCRGCLEKALGLLPPF